MCQTPKNELPQSASSSTGGRNGNYGNNGGWDDWDNDDFKSSNDMRRNQSVFDFRGGSGGMGVMSAKSKSNEDIYSREQLEAFAANKESFILRNFFENESRPEGIPPSQGGKYVGFGSSPLPTQRNTNSQEDVLSVVSKGFGRLSLVAGSAAQFAATVVQAGTNELTSKINTCNAFYCEDFVPNQNYKQKMWAES